MKCKACGRELIAGTKKCPYCGEMNVDSGMKANDTFDWSIGEEDSKKQKKKKDVVIDWTTGEIFDRSAHESDKKEKNWAEPDDVKNLFSFESENEEFQEVLDRQVDMIADSEPEYIPETPRIFDLPSSMDMGLFDSLINDDTEVSLVTESGEEILLSEGKSGETEETTYEPSFDTDTKEEHLKFENPLKEKESGIPENTVSDDNEPVENESYTPEDEDRVSKGLRRLMEAEEKFKSDMERASYLTPEETAQAEKLEEKNRKLTFVPTVSFRSIEDEYEAYCDENGIERRTAEPAADDNVETPQVKDRRKDKKNNKEVEIKINEASGTKVTVKTQEIRLSSLDNEINKAQTREVDMDEVKAAKNVQVSVEVNAAQGNASVEVTRRHDGATVVKTVDQGSDEYIYTNDNKEPEQTEAEVIEESEPLDSKTFWERPKTDSRMTITDIFGPEARNILDQIDKTYSVAKGESKKDKNKDIEDSLILDIQPEDIAMTADQTAALHTVSTDMPETVPEPEPEYDLQPEVASGEEPMPEAEPEEPEILPEPETEQQEETEETEPETEAEEQEEQPEPEEAAEDLSERKTMPFIEIPERKTIEIGDKREKEEEKSVPDTKTEKTVSKMETVRQKKRTEHAKKKLMEENNPEKQGMSPLLKVLIAIFVIILLAEFSVIGIKLYARDSQADIFIDKVEDTVSGIFKGRSENDDSETVNYLSNIMREDNLV